MKTETLESFIDAATIVSMITMFCWISSYIVSIASV